VTLVRILVADDHRRVRQAIRCLLSVNHDWQVVAEADDGAEAVRVASDIKPDLAILDAAMTPVNGIEAARQIAQASPETRIVVLTIYDDEKYVIDAFEAGAHAYVLKDVADSDLVQAAEAVLSGRRFVSSGADVQLPARYIPPEGNSTLS
jgi:DNA-binding NarL/FixJ family response regulator